MKLHKVFIWLGLLALLLGAVSVATAAPPLQKPTPPASDRAQQAGTAADQASDQDDLYRQWQEGKISDKEYDRLAPAGGCGPQAGWPGPDGFGYTGQAATYNWVEISGSGTPVYLSDDNYLGPFPVGFSFNFYGTNYTEFYAASNGYISFGAGSSTLTNQCPLPNATTPNNIIALMWDDLDPGDTNDPVYYQTFDPCPIGTGACLVVQYDDFCHYPGGATCTIAGTWEVILFANTGNVILQFEDGGGEEGSGSTTGIEGNNFAADHGLTYACDTVASIPDGLAIEFLFPTGLMLSPDRAAKQGCEDSDVTYTLTLANDTGADGTFDLIYASVWPISGPANLFVAQGSSANFDVVVHIPCGGVSDVATVTASGMGYTDSSTLTTSVTAGGFTEWESIDSINSLGRSRPAAAAVNGKVYLFGGEVSGGREATVEEFDPAVGVWVTKSGLMPTPASNICAAAIGTDVYIPGGYDAAGVYLATLQVYHTDTDTWETIATDPLPAPRAGPGCAALEGKLYAFGGADPAYQSTAHVYDPAAPAGARWTALPNMANARAYLAGTAVGGKVYAVGGRDAATVDFAYVEAYDPADGLWHTVTNMNTARGGPGAMFWGDTLVVCGGGWSTYLNTCETYDTAQGYAGTWTDLPQTMIQGRRTFAYASLPNALYAVAGYNGTFLTSAERLPTFTCPPCFDVWKEAPLVARNGDVVSYTIALNPPYLVPGMYMVDPLPAGVEYADNLNWTIGDAWYDAGENAVHWTYNPPKAVKRAPAAQPASKGDAASAADLAGGPEAASAPAPQGAVPTFVYPEAVLWDNGPLVTHPGACSGMDASRLQGALGMTIYGFGHQFSVGNRMADDFEITNPTGWQIEQITFFAYQTGAPTSPSPITGVYYQIWDGPPNDPGSSIVFGDLTTNRLLSSTFTNIQRDWDNGTCPGTRYIFADVASAGVTLPPGTYWLDWMTDGSLTSGPWAPPVTILGQTTTGNAMQYTTSSGAWGPANDSGTLTQQGMPFIVEGEALPPPRVTFDVMVTGHCGDLIVNEGVVRMLSAVKGFGAATKVAGEADIAVQPLALETAVCPDAAGVETLMICNEGDCPLGWLLYERTPVSRLAGSMPFVPVSVAATGPAPEGLSVSSPAPKHLAQPAAPANPEAVLWDQPLSTVNQAAYVDQEFSDFPSYSSFLADDFVNGGEWLINSIFIPGDGWNGFSNLMDASALTWQIYADNGSGLPDGDPSGSGNPPVWTMTLPPGDPQVIITPGAPGGMPSNTTLNLVAPLILPPGHWWLVFYPTAPFGTFGQYGRQPADTTNGYAGKFVNPGGGFGLGTAWQDWSVLGPTQPDIAFRLEGAPLPPAADIPWLSESPVSGVVARGECQEVEVTFDATGLAPGDYGGELIIGSNDPDTPARTVPVMLTVPEAVYGADFTWMPAVPRVGDTVHFTGSAGGGTPPFTWAWDFGDGATGSGIDVAHVYAVANTYGVELTVANQCGQSTKTGMLTVEPAFRYVYLPIVVKNY